MGAFSKIAVGPRARKPVGLPLPGSRIDPETGEIDGPSIMLDVRPLRPDEYATVLEQARAYAVKRGIAEPTIDHELYEHARMVYTLALACVDHDAPHDAPNPAPFFDGGAEQIFASELLSPELVSFLYAHQQKAQVEHSPLIDDLTPKEFVAGVARVAGGDFNFFACMRPGTQWSFVHSMASEFVRSMMRESQPSLPSAPQEATTA